MPKIKTKFICQECGYESPKWMGKCPECGVWNSLVEELEQNNDKTYIATTNMIMPLTVDEIEVTEEERLKTGSDELDRVLGGGIVRGSLILVGGDPGIGKSTLLLQVSKNLSLNGYKVFYISGEESEKQIKIRAQRLKVKGSNLYIVSETNLDILEKHIQNLKPDIIIVDSIQTMFKMELQSAPGSVSQVRESTLTFMRIAKGLSIPIFIVGHVTKEGAIAGPRVLEHMVDTVLYFEGERHHTYRVIRAVKNRFGSTNEIGIFEMKGDGLKEVLNPSEVMLSGRPEDVPGSAVVCSLEGTRPVLVEIQALTSATAFGMPRRMATGIDYNRVVLLMAVLEKRVGMQLQTFDAYINVVGGLKLDEPACDLGIVCAIASSFRNIPINSKTVVIGELGLTGEVRGVNFIEKRILEAQKLGFERCIIPYENIKAIEDKLDINVIGVKNIYEVLEEVLGG
ncbi:DNA repair protein RadA [Caloramator sp. ALD01]|uniref:DNA repair protein RadA n=1 Tax=Caloramator sp. ALD01 TaxID=1031288 RepID=UPI0004297C71|nr:DNA repair protein RadA [Caloramator sp. ALD01]